MNTKYAIFITLTRGYLYGLNATMNALERNGTNAAYEIVYDDANDPKFKQYIEKSKTAFNFPVNWVHRNTLKSNYRMNWFHYKYQRALDIWNKYDVVCFTDADLFMYTSLTELFDRCKNEKKLVLDTNPKYTGGKKFWKLGDLRGMTDVNWGKPYWFYTDTPIFFNTKVPKHRKIMEDWQELCSQESLPNLAPEQNQPGGGLNRSLCKNLESFDEVIEINGWEWLAELGHFKYKLELRDDKLFWAEGPYDGKQILANHNRWWQQGRVIGEMKRGQSKLFLDNSNKVLKLMKKYNDLKLSEYVEHHEEGLIEY